MALKLTHFGLTITNLSVRLLHKAFVILLVLVTQVHLNLRFLQPQLHVFNFIDDVFDFDFEVVSREFIVLLHQLAVDLWQMGRLVDCSLTEHLLVVNCFVYHALQL